MTLEARKEPLGLFGPFISQTGTELVLKEKVASLSGDSFTVTDSNGQPVLKVQGEAMSLSGRTHVTDLQDKHIFDIRKEHFTLHTTFYAEDGKGEKILEVKSKFSLASSKAVITFNNALGDGAPIELNMKGDFLNRHAEIVDSAGVPVALIRRKGFNVRNLLGGQDTYIVTVAAGVDLALVTAICVCFDEKNREK